MSEKDQQAYEEQLKNILHVTFEKNSDEISQKYLLSNLTSFSEDILTIQLNFSDPILVSQGQ